MAPSPGKMYHARVRNLQMFQEPKRAYTAFCVALSSVIIASSLLSVGLWAAGKAPMFVLYHAIEVEDGVGGKDFHFRYLLAKALKDGYSPYGPLPPEYQSSPVYPPFTHWFYSLFVDIGYAPLYGLHNAVQVVAVLAVAAWVLCAAGAPALAAPTLVLLASAMLVTPVGIIGLERGQFELYLTASYLLAYALLFHGGRGRAAVAGLLASFKFSSVTFLGPFLGIAFLFHKGCRKDIAALTGAMAFLLLVFFPDLPLFFGHLLGHESDRGSMGISFARIMPFVFSKFVIFISTGVFAAAFLRRVPRECAGDALLAASFPLALCLLLQSAGFGTLAFEYRNITLISLVPGLLLWLRHVRASSSLGLLCTGAYAVILFACLRIVSLPPWSLLGRFTEIMQAWFILLSSLCMLAVAVGFVWLQKPLREENSLPPI